MPAVSVSLLSSLLARSTLSATLRKSDAISQAIRARAVPPIRFGR
jgi:hypothetical protein